MNPATSTAIAIAGSVPAVITDPAAITRRDALLAESSSVVRVASAIEYEAAGGIVADLKRITTEVERARKAIKAPVIELGKNIDAAAEAFVAQVQREIARVGPMLVAWDQEQARIRAEAERKAREEAERVERERKAKEEEEARRVAEAKAAEERARLEAEEAARIANATQDNNARAEADAKAREADQAAQKAQEVQQQANLDAITAPPAAPAAPMPPRAPKVAGLRLRQVQCHEVEDILALYKARPDLVRLEPIVGAINAALEAGETLPGVRGWKESRA